MDNGWIKLHRKLEEWDWYKDVNTKALFLHLLIKANHKQKKWRGRIINRGEVLTGRKKLALELGLSEQNIRTSIKHLKSTNEITIKSTSAYSVIKLNNYNSHQQDNQPTNQQPTNNQPTPNHKQECNNEKKEKKNTIIIEKTEIEKAIDDFIDMRKKIRKPLTDRGKELMVKKLEEISNGEEKIMIQVLEQSIMNCWQGIFPLKENKKDIFDGVGIIDITDLG